MNNISLAHKQPALGWNANEVTCDSEEETEFVCQRPLYLKAERKPTSA